ncbi:hypothetical protein Trydic_g11400 [Trypoxylus dichotomus]
MNGTEEGFDLETSWESQNVLSTYQIITFIWSVLCIIPNGILIHILSKKTLRQSPLYLILLNWSVSATDLDKYIIFVHRQSREYLNEAYKLVKITE